MSPTRTLEGLSVRALALLFGGGFAVILFGVAIAIGLSLSNAQATDELAAENQARAVERDRTVNGLQKQIDDTREVAEENGRRLEKKGGSAVPLPPTTAPPAAPAPPTTLPGAVQTGPPGPQGPPPSPEQIAIAVGAYCRDTGECRGPSGRPGTPGKEGTPGKAGENVTPAQAAAAIATYCNANGQCKGDTGDQGPGPSDEQVLAAVATFCAAGQCKGKDGDDGKKGDDGDRGPAGRGVKSITCNSDGRFIVTYSDDETEDAGSCAPRPAPTETVTEPGPTETVTEPGPTTTITVSPTEEPTQEES